MAWRDGTRGLLFIWVACLAVAIGISSLLDLGIVASFVLGCVSGYVAYLIWALRRALH